MIFMQIYTNYFEITNFLAKFYHIIAAPYFSEEDVIVEVGELRGKLTQLGAPCCLYYFLLCHNIE